eukprot:CAMPEP_0195510990 /NCGR_PEP_ID=MMETSP0794_2-20130614/3466_1 /TAXON_ID=515487 /ORGANISM="Stephanopyxis turris, Strain CCMP 815" /LENGTH=490 /DNA_ID=CAMNT_0040638519 /DNA_START=76 /DNA_END=1548 /DNA_ORIENTATION=+
MAVFGDGIISQPPPDSPVDFDLTSTTNITNAQPKSSTSPTSSSKAVVPPADDTRSSTDCCCTICQEEFHSAPIGVTNPCGHVFHQECFGQWDATSRARCGSRTRYKGTSCPLCCTTVVNFVHIYAGFCASGVSNSGGDGGGGNTMKALNDTKQELNAAVGRISDINAKLENATQDKLNAVEAVKTELENERYLHNCTRRKAVNHLKQFHNSETKRKQLENEMRSTLALVSTMKEKHRAEMEKYNHDNNVEMKQTMVNRSKLVSRVEELKEENRRLARKLEVMVKKDSDTVEMKKLENRLARLEEERLTSEAMKYLEKKRSKFTGGTVGRKRKMEETDYDRLAKLEDERVKSEAIKQLDKKGGGKRKMEEAETDSDGTVDYNSRRTKIKLVSLKTAKKMRSSKLLNVSTANHQKFSSAANASNSTNSTISRTSNADKLLQGPNKSSYRGMLLPNQNRSTSVSHSQQPMLYKRKSAIGLGGKMDIRNMFSKK